MKKRLFIEGMHCVNCVKGLEAALTEDIDGVKVDVISLEGNYADIDVDNGVTDEALRIAVEELEFKLVGIEEIIV
ncbi:heavy-metal-associated domain-containing protein [Peptostreptococcus sp. D1]|uniref:heavy-metal-associated domain-containing protein n=1 Tax=Peptostreptococcus sp. D1 TaxID=72304 RepID=UPI0008EE8579|nr:heavy-metal-associated domain-containing protein [Peptostreptococcus sp. D1]SFE14542.1 Copper chaperone CopZ [Peptostreptococcus sp. D1]